MLCIPRALLLDFGGVIVDSPVLRSAPVALVDRLYQLTDHALSKERISADLIDGARTYTAWRDQVGSQNYPAEATHVQVWTDFVTPQWPAAARDVVHQHATSLSYAWTVQPDWALRPGMLEVLDTAATLGLPVAVVSNTLCGAAHRDFLADLGIADRFTAQFYSDEAGVRKPNPHLAWLAAAALDAPIASCWFVGDSLPRDIECARRAGVGAAVLMRSDRTRRDPPNSAVAPDAVVDDGHGLLALLAPATATA